MQQDICCTQHLLSAGHVTDCQAYLMCWGMLLLRKSETSVMACR